MSEKTGPTWFLGLLRTAQGSQWDRDLKGSNHVAGSVTLASPLSFLSPCCGIVCSLVLILAPSPERGKTTQCLVPRRLSKGYCWWHHFCGFLPACVLGKPTRSEAVCSTPVGGSGPGLGAGSRL